MRRVSWQELRDVCKLAGCVEVRTRGDHLIMTKPGMARPVVIKMDRNLGDDIIFSNLRTIGLSRKEFDKLMNQVRGGRRR